MIARQKMTELGEIPENWQLVPLESFAEIITGNTPSTLDLSNYNGIYPWVTPTDLSNRKNIVQTARTLSEKGLRDARVLPSNSILITCIASIGKNAILRKVGSCNQQINAILPSNIHDSDFLYYYMESQKSRLLTLSAATAVSIINKSTFQKFKVVLPPLPEQQKIADILSTVDEKIDVIEAQITQTQELKKGLMQLLLTKGIGHAEFKDSPLGEIPESWEVVRFNELLQKRENALCYGILQPGTGVVNGIKMLRTVDLNDVGLSGTKILEVAPEISRTSEKTILEGNEVLLSVMGTLGRTIVVPDKWRGWNVNRALAVIRINNKMHSHFLCYYFKSPNFLRIVDRQSLGSAQMRINLSDLREYLIPLPSLAEQNQIVNVLAEVDSKLRILNGKKICWEQLKVGLMQQLLTGKIRVNQLIKNEMFA